MQSKGDPNKRNCPLKKRNWRPTYSFRLAMNTGNSLIFSIWKRVNVVSFCATKTCSEHLKNWHCEIKWLNIYLGCLKKITKVRAISLLCLTDVSRKAIYMTWFGSLSGLNEWQRWDQNLGGSSFQAVHHITELYSQIKFYLQEAWLTFTEAREFITSWAANIFESILSCC